MEGRLSPVPGVAAVMPGLDWSAPWYQPFQGVGQAVAARVAAGEPVHAALDAQPGAPVRFVAQAAIPEGQAYEHFIFDRKACPSRDNLHDFFNGLCWLHLPLAKQRLNALQAAQIQARGVGAMRGPVRDAITVFDENGALLQAPDALWEALLARRWTHLFGSLRPLWAQARLVLFGHALLEKLAAPRKDMTAHVWRADAPLGSLPAADAWLAGQLDAATLASKPFTPLPVLGVPGWWAPNETPAFYDDATVFRPARRG